MVQNQFQNFYEGVFSSQNVKNKIFLIFLLPIATAIFTAFIGFQYLIIPLALVISLVFLRYWVIMLGCFIGMLPLIWAVFPDNFVTISFVLFVSLIFIWIMRRFLIIEPRPIFPRFMFIFFGLFIIAIIFSALNGGVTPAEAKNAGRFLIFFTMVYFLYEMIEPRYYFSILVMLTIPLIIGGLFLIEVYANTGGLIGLLEMYRMKPGGIFLNVNSFGNSLMAIVTIWVALCMAVRKKPIRYLFIFIALFLILVLFLTNSRSAMFGFSIAMIVLSYWYKKLRYILFMCLFLSLIVLSLPAVRAVISLGLRLERGTSSRTEIWANSEKMIKEHWLLGIGMGNFRVDYGHFFRNQHDRWFFKEVPNAHNLLINHTTELGMPGFLLVIALFVISLKTGKNAIIKMNQPIDKAFVLGIWATIIGFWGWSIFEAGGIIGDGRIYPDILFWFLLCVLLKLNIAISEKANFVFVNPRYNSMLN